MNPDWAGFTALAESLVSFTLLANRDDWNTTGLNRAWLCSTAGDCAAPPQRVMNAGIGATQYASVQVSNVLVSGTVAKLVPPRMNDESFRMPHEARTLVLNGTGTWWVMSNTESIAPLAPHLTLMSAARATVVVTPSRLRGGLFCTVKYEFSWKMPTPGIEPALRLRSAWTQVPEAG